MLSSPSWRTSFESGWKTVGEAPRWHDPECVVRAKAGSSRSAGTAGEGCSSGRSAGSRRHSVMEHNFGSGSGDGGRHRTSREAGAGAGAPTAGRRTKSAAPALGGRRDGTLGRMGRSSTREDLVNATSALHFSQGPGAKASHLRPLVGSDRSRKLGQASSPCVQRGTLRSLLEGVWHRRLRVLAESRRRTLDVERCSETREVDT
mgnify:CR=1 FL=1